MLRLTTQGAMNLLLLLVLGVSSLSCHEAPTVTEQDGQEAIYTAIRDGDLEAVDQILDRDPTSLHSRNEAGREPIQEACLLGRPAILELLVSRGADVNDRDRAENTTLHWAVHAFVEPEVRGEMAAYLLAEDPALATTENINGITPLHWAGNELPQTVQLLLENGADLDARDQNGMTPLHHWTRYWMDDESVLLIQSGADVEAQDPFGRTALHLAAIGGRGDKYRMLRDFGADLNAKDDEGLTPATYARKFGHVELADQIVADGGLESGDLAASTSATLLVQGAGPGNAGIWFLDSNGWAVRTEHELLIFDYTEWGPMPAVPGLVNGRIRGMELSGLSVTVFATSPGAWEERLLELRDHVPDVRFVLGFQPDDPAGITVMDKEATLRVGALGVTTAKSQHGGTAFLVQADGLTIFHSGIPDRYRTEGAAAWATSLDRLVAGLGMGGTGIDVSGPRDTGTEGAGAADTGQIDLAFLPVFVAGDEEALALDGFTEVMGLIRPKVVFTSGGSGAHRYLLRQAAALIEEASDGALMQRARAGTIALAPENRGDFFLLGPEGAVRR
jgi:ankyrin repeat protein